LPEGDHQYKFVVDGKWEHDPTQTIIDDNFSGKNTIVTVKKSDFEVMDALEMDSNQQAANKAANSTFSFKYTYLKKGVFYIEVL
jgi:type 1 glutamine amidotransferase